MSTRHTASLLSLLAAVASVAFLAASAAAPPQGALDQAAERWVRDTLRGMTLDEKVGQLLAPAINAVYTPADSDIDEQKMHLVRDLHVGGMHVFGGAEAMPQAMLNPNYGTGGGASRKGDPYAAAVFLNRLQQAAKIPLLTTADFEGGTNYILNGGTRFPRAMVIGASRDPQLAFRAGRIAAQEGRSVGVMVDFYPVLDVNNNPRNPIINLRSFGEDVGLVTEMGRQFIKGIQAGGMLSTAKHFPGHGDTNVDTHLGLAVIEHPRDHLDKVELPPFRMAVEAGVDAFMSTHIVLPALDPAPGVPATLSRPILTGLLRDEMKFQGIIYTDSMSMHAISKNFGNGQAAAMAVKAGVDQVLDIPEPDAAFAAIKAAVQAGEIPEQQVNASVERLLRVKARMGLHGNRAVDVAAIASRFGGRANAAAAAETCERGLTLLKDDRNQVPLRVAKDARVLYLSVLDYASGWREGAPSRSFIPALKQRWPNATAIEITDRTTASEMELIRVLARQADAVVAGVFVRISSYSGRMDLSPAQVSLLEGVAADPQKPFVAVLFGNPYTAMALAKLPALLVTYEQFDAMEAAAVRAVAGEIPIGGKLPITMPGLFPAGTGLARAAVAPSREAGRAPDIELVPLSGDVWVHTTWAIVGGSPTPSNGLAVRTSEGVVLVDTAWTDEQTARLLKAIEARVGVRVTQAIGTHAHDDRIGGLNALKAAGIPVATGRLTRDLAVAQGFPAPRALKSPSDTLVVGGRRFEVFFPGAGHTRDNVVVWLPDAKVLFGGCLLKAMNTKSRGNVADADIEAWPASVGALARRYPQAVTVVPGHGPWGGPELLQHTIEVVRQ